jgi:hypothetical protein
MPNLSGFFSAKNVMRSVVSLETRRGKRMTIKEIQNRIRQRKYRFSGHSVKRMIKRNMTRQEVESAILTGEII